MPTAVAQVSKLLLLQRFCQLSAIELEDAFLARMLEDPSILDCPFPFGEMETGMSGACAATASPPTITLFPRLKCVFDEEAALDVVAGAAREAACANGANLDLSQFLRTVVDEMSDVLPGNERLVTYAAQLAQEYLRAGDVSGARHQINQALQVRRLLLLEQQY